MAGQTYIVKTDKGEFEVDAQGNLMNPPATSAAPGGPLGDHPLLGAGLGAAGGMALASLAPEVGIPLWLLEAIGGGAGGLLGGKLGGSQSPAFDAAAGAAGPLAGPLLKGAGAVIGSRVGGPAAGLGIGQMLGHPYIGLGLGRIAGKEVGGAMKAAGGVLERSMPGALIRGTLGATEEAASGALSAAEKAGLVKQGYSPEMITKIEQGAAKGPANVIPNGGPKPVGLKQPPPPAGPDPANLSRARMSTSTPQDLAETLDTVGKGAQVDTGARLRPMPNESGFRPEEHPPGADNATPSKKWLELSNQSANEQGNESDIQRIKRLIQAALGEMK